jgi:predicted DNA-binding protein
MPSKSSKSSKSSKQNRRIGRPPAGARAGEKVKDYPQLSIRLPTEVKAKLQALSLISSRPQWRLIAEAIECFLRQCPEEEQRMVAELVGRSRSRAGKARRE